MAIGVLVLGESGTGKSYSMKNFEESEVKVLSVKKPILPFRKKMEIVRTPDEASIIREMKNTTKKNIVVDDFQYIMGVPMMKRSLEKGWDKFSEIQYDYFKVLDAIEELPDDVIVYFISHTEVTEDGQTKIKTIGKALDKYITIEGLFMIVLGTKVSDGKYFFTTQNSGSDTVKSPEDMFPSVLIPNDMKYVSDKIRNYYFMTGAKSDAEIKSEDAQHTVTEEPKKSRRSRKMEEAEKAVEQTTAVVEAVAGDREEVPFEEVVASMETDSKNLWKTCTKDTCFYDAENDNFIRKHEGDEINPEWKEISEDEFNAGLKRISGEEPVRRTRRTRKVRGEA